MESFFIADTHLGHKNIVLGTSEWEDKQECRNFNTLEEHDSFIIDNINNTAGVDDRLYILGDFVFGGKDNIPKYRDRILCKNIILIRGNHDIHMHKNSSVLHNGKYINVNSLFSNVYDMLDFKIGTTKLVLCHYPIMSWHRAASGSIHLYGHIHKDMKEVYNYIGSRFGLSNNAVCVSAECINFTPASLSDIKYIVNAKNKR